MEEKENIEKKNNKIVLYAVVVCIIAVIAIGVGFYFYNNKPIDNNNQNENNVENKDDDKQYIKILDNKKVLRADLNLTEYARINYSKVDSVNGVTFIDIIEPDFQFETHYLLCYDKDGNLIFDVRDFNDQDNDNNRYKYNGTFEYDENANILSFYTKLFLGESDEATGEAFNDKGLSELTKEEKQILGNYSDEVKYDYKYEDGSFTLLEKTEISKLKDNDYYRNIL